MGSSAADAAPGALLGYGSVQGGRRGSTEKSIGYLLQDSAPFTAVEHLARLGIHNKLPNLGLAPCLRWREPHRHQPDDSLRDLEDRVVDAEALSTMERQAHIGFLLGDVGRDMQTGTDCDVDFYFRTSRNHGSAEMHCSGHDVPPQARGAL